MSIIFIIGGSKSGKSNFAENIILKTGKFPVYIATAEKSDSDVFKRINQHRQRRSKIWKTCECPINLINSIEKFIKKDYSILIECLTLWLTNLFFYKKDVDFYCNSLILFLKKNKIFLNLVIVSNEINLGIVPKKKFLRDFLEYQERLNQNIANISDEVYLIISGLPLKLK